MALPFLPGNSFNSNLGKTKFHKSQAFDYKEDLAVVNLHKPGIGGKLLLGQSPVKNNSVYPKGLGGDKPAWVAFDKQVLRFYAYFQEAVQEKREEQYRIRKCEILFYLEDDTVQVNEPRLDNSGIPQGTLIRRHRIPLPPPKDELFHTVHDFNVGEQMIFHGRVFQITDCDEFTRNFLTKMGVRVPPSQDTPADPYTSHRNDLTAAMQPMRPYERQDTLRQFLDHDREVLRFYCFWDDSDSMFGDPREMELHYFLADDTIEIVEKIPPNSGRDAVSMFLRRAKLPREPLPVYQPGVQTKRTVLNVFGPTGHGGRYLLDSLKTGSIESDYYHDSDLVLGSTLNIWGRKLLICDCDKFTREYYKSKYGIDKFEPVDVPKPETRPVKREIPPYNGFGSMEDSLATCLHLIPKPHRKDFVKFMEKDRNGLDCNVLRFVAQMDTTRPIDQDRRFIIFYHLSDDTISVFEPPLRNSGVMGGAFLERDRVVKTRIADCDDLVYYQPEDLYVGGRMQIHKHNFLLIDADEYALRYMEQHKGQFPQANLSLILSKLRGPASTYFTHIKDRFTEADTNNSKTLSFEQFRSVVLSLSRGMLNEHEVLTLARFYGERQYPILTTLVWVIQESLQKINYTDFPKLLSALQAEDMGEGGFMSRDMVRFICHKVGLPLSDQLIDGAIMNCQTNGVDHMDYQQFVKLLDWKNHPLPREQKKAPAGAFGETFSGFSNWTKTLGPIDYPALISHLQTVQ